MIICHLDFSLPPVLCSQHWIDSRIVGIFAEQTFALVSYCSPAAATTTPYIVASSSRRRLRGRRRLQTRRPSYRRPVSGRHAQPPAGAATTTPSHVAATALAPPPVVQTAGHCSPRHQPTPAGGLLFVARPRCRRRSSVQSAGVARRRLPSRDDRWSSPVRAAAAPAALLYTAARTRRQHNTLPRARRCRASCAITRRRRAHY